MPRKKTKVQLEEDWTDFNFYNLSGSLNCHLPLVGCTFVFSLLDMSYIM